MSIKTLATLAALVAAAPVAAQTPITPGQTVTGTLEDGDRQMEDGAYYDAYVIRGRPGDRVVVRMTSDDFDTYLHWGYEDADGDWRDEDENDDAGDGTDSRLVVQLDGDGAYELRAAGFDEGEEGAYELRVSPTSAPRPVPVRIGQTIEGELADGDAEGEEGYEDHYVIRGRPGTVATLDVESGDFDTYVLFGAWRDGELEDEDEDDDGGQETNSQLVVEFEEEAEYHIVVRAFDGEGGGRYTLRVTEGDVSGEWDDEESEDWSDDEGDDSDDGDEWSDEEGPDEDASEEEDFDGSDSDEDLSGVGPDVLEVTADDEVEGVLSATSAEDPNGGGRFQEFTYRARAGERLRVRVSSSDIDAYVALGTGTRNGFQALAEDDDGGPGLDAELEWTVEEDGDYTIRVSSAVFGEMGPFILRLDSGR
jgi:hypothetical protein